MNLAKIGLFDAKTRLSELIEKVEEGQSFCITKRGKPVAELRPIPSEKAQLTKGCAAHEAYWMAPDFTTTPDDFKEYR